MSIQALVNIILTTNTKDIEHPNHTIIIRRVLLEVGHLRQDSNVFVGRPRLVRPLADDHRALEARARNGGDLVVGISSRRLSITFQSKSLRTRLLFLH